MKAVYHEIGQVLKVEVELSEIPILLKRKIINEIVMDADLQLTKEQIEKANRWLKEQMEK